nr:uncharacterized protein LOC105333024 [Crassostrea gigas]
MDQNSVLKYIKNRMRNIFTFKIICLMVFQISYMDATYLCSYINGTICCPGFIWDYDLKTCTICKEGSAEIDCRDKCFFPFNELNCQSACNCTEKDCDHVKGCKRKSKENPHESHIRIEINRTNTTIEQSTVRKKISNGIKGIRNSEQKHLKLDTTTTMIGIIVLTQVSIVLIILITCTYLLESCKTMTKVHDIETIELTSV